MFRSAAAPAGLIGLVTLAVTACLSFVSREPELGLLEVAGAVGAAPARVDSIWSGYSLREQGFLLYEPGRSALLVTSGPPPAGFTPVPDSTLPARLQERTYAFAEALPGLEGGVDTEYRIGEGITTAYSPSGSSLGPGLAELYHEGFHTYQHQHFARDSVQGEWVASESLTREFAAMVEVERRLLSSALRLDPGMELDSLLRSFLAVRRERLHEVPARVREVERSLERAEGSATLVGYRLAAATVDSDPERVVLDAVQEYLTMPLDRFGGDRATQLMRWRAYGTGAALGILLDRKGVVWWGPVERGTAFDALLSEAVGVDPGRSASLARAALEGFGYDEILEGVVDTPPAGEELEAFFGLAPVRLVIEVLPRDTAGYDLGVSYNTSSGFWDRLLGRRHGTSRPEPKLTLIWNPDVLHTSDPERAGFSLRVEDRPVALDGRGGEGGGGEGRRRLVVLLPERPTVQGESMGAGRKHFPRGVVIAGEGLRFRTDLPADVVVSGADSVHVRISP